MNYLTWLALTIHAFLIPAWLIVALTTKKKDTRIFSVCMMIFSIAWVVWIVVYRIWLMG
jgi:hypothetical protein